MTTSAKKEVASKESAKKSTKETAEKPVVKTEAAKAPAKAKTEVPRAAPTVVENHKTYSAKPSEVDKKWLIIDAKDMVLGRLASQVAILLRGKHKPSFTPHIDCGDNVIIINASGIHLSGKKADRKDGKFYYRHTGYIGGIKETTAGKILAGKYPERVVQLAVQRMISRNKMGRKQMGNLHVYPGVEHPHAGQKPQAFDVAGKNVKNTIRK